MEYTADEVFTKMGDSEQRKVLFILPIQIGSGIFQLFQYFSMRVVATFLYKCGNKER
jgi:hypothetical protein